jgi:hypothetical protein
MCRYAGGSDNMIMNCQGFSCNMLYSSPRDSFNLTEWSCNCKLLLRRDPTFSNQKLKTLSNIQKTGVGVEDKSFNSLYNKKNSSLLMLLQRGDSDKNYDVQEHKWNNNEKNTAQTHFTYWLFMTYPFLLRSRNPDRYHHTLLSYSFLLVAGWWMLNSYNYFLPPWESQNIRTLCQWLNDQENPGAFGFSSWILGSIVTQLF